MTDCPCGSGLSYSDCCEPFITGKENAPTAEKLMRSRYTAYAMEQIEYLHDSLHPDHRADHDVNAARKWAADSDWLGLKILNIEKGQENDEEGIVEFQASYREKGQVRQLHEISRFEKKDGRWFYVDGEMPKPETVRHEAQKVGRNDPCPCGSGKKYKKCCGR